MSTGSSKGGQQQQQPMTAMTSNVNQSNLPAYAQPYFTSLMDRAQAVSNNPYQAYTGQRVADFTGQQNQAFQNTTNNVGNYQPFFNQAGQNFNNANFDPTQVNNTYSAQNYNPQQWTDPGVAQSYMNPYQQQVTDINKRQAFVDYGQQQQQRNSQAASAGAFGGYRQGIVQALDDRTFNQQLQDIQNTGANNAYNTGLGAFNQDRSALIGANQINQQNQQAQSQLGMSAAGANNQYGLAAAQQNLATGQAQAGLGQATQAAGQADVNALLNTGGIQQAQKQQGLDVAYQNFIDQRDYDRQNLNWMSGILRGVPVTANSSTTGYQASPSALSQISGLGLGAAGLSKILG